MTRVTKRFLKWNDVEWGMKTPCQDCPFRISSPLHPGIGKDLPDLVRQLRTDRNVIHTCHNTDPLADGFRPGYHGPVEHCAGMLVMLERENEWTKPMFAAYTSGRWDPGAMDETAPVYAIRDMVGAYVKWFKRMLADRRREGAIVR